MIRVTALLLAVLTVAGCSTPASTTRGATTGPAIRYEVGIPELVNERFSVSATFDGIADDTLVYHFPVWAPGAYDIVHFGRYVRDLRATSADGRALTVLRDDSSTYRILGVTPGTRLSYLVQDIEYVSNSAWFGLSDIEPTWAFANGPAIFGYPEGLKEVTHYVTYHAPENWSTAVALDPVGEPGGDSYVAASYDELADAPVQMGNYQRFEFAYKGVPHIITVTAPEELHDSTSEELVETTRRIVAAMTDLFGEVPYHRYLFQHFLHRLGPGSARGGFGALEHANSSTYRMPFHGQESVAASLASVIAHEFWHLWSPKRIHVHELGPFDYQKGPETTSLWFAEGLTEYYARAINARIGLSTPSGFFGEFQRDMAGLYRREQHEAMTELSRRIVHAPTSELVDLYKKGPLLGFLLDAEIRTQTGNRKSLDDAFRFFNNEYAKKGKTFGDEEIIPIMERATGAKLGEFYARYIAGTDTLPFDRAFTQSGLAYVVRDTMQPALGAVLEPAKGGVRIAQVLPGGSAEAMGLRAGDVLTTLNYDGYTIPAAALPLDYVDSFFANEDDEETGEGGAVRYAIESVTITKDGATTRVPAKVLSSPSTVSRLDIDPNARGLPLEIRRSMLGF